MSLSSNPVHLRPFWLKGKGHLKCWLQKNEANIWVLNLTFNFVLPTLSQVVLHN